MLFKTPKWIVAGLLVIGAGALAIPVLFDDQDGSQPAPRFEAKQKRSLVNQDIALTDRLCRLQCSADLKQTIAALQGVPDGKAAARLTAARAENPHMMLLNWKNKQGGAIKSGELSPAVQSNLSSYIKSAELSLNEGREYASSRIRVDGEHYLVLAVPDHSGGGIVGVVRQSILNEVSDHQRKNLRLVPYPPEGNYKIESVDSDTHRDIHVNKGEENGGASHYHKKQVVVKFKTAPRPDQLSRIRTDLRASMIRKLGYTYVIESKKDTAESMLKYFRKNRNVEYAEPHYLYMTNTMNETNGTNETNGENESPDSVPNDYLFEPYQWNLPITETINGWNISKGSDEIVIGVIDTGVDLNHPDLRDRLVEGYNVVDPNRPPMDDVGHGTHVAGVISASVNNIEGVAGMTWYDKVLPVKALDETGAGSTYAVAEGIIWATDQGAKVINLSLGNYAQAEFLHDAVRYAFDNDVVLIAATGNDNTADPGYPAAYPEVFAVSATDERRNRAPFSNYGDYVDVVAPGVGIASTYPHNQYAALSGTSMACPHVTALAALIRSVNPDLKNTEVMDIIRNTATDLGSPGKDPQYGYGQINVEAALAEAQGNVNGNNTDSIRLLPDWIRRQLNRILMNL